MRFYYGSYIAGMYALLSSFWWERTPRLRTWRCLVLPAAHPM